jgi:AraC-like DNA-binding protein
MKNKKNSSFVDRVVEFILSRKDEELATLTETAVADTLGLARSTLLQGFEREQNMTLARFISREKIYRAFFMIENNQAISTLEIAKKLGFTRLKDFIHEFQSIFLIEPDRYLRLMRMKKNYQPLKPALL